MARLLLWRARACRPESLYSVLLMNEPLLTLHALDYAVILVYLGATLVIGYWVSRSVHSGSDFFLAGRSLPWWAVGFSLVATDIGGTDIVGLGGMAHAYGMAAANFDWIGCIPAMLIGAFVFIPHFWRCGITTIPELLERRFDVRVRSAVSLAWFVFMACNLGVMLVAAARFMDGLAQWDPYLSILTTAILVAIYTYSGGLAAVVYTDVLQGCIMIGGCLLVTLVGLWEFGGWQPLQEAVQSTLANASAARTSNGEPPLPITHFDLILPVDTASPYPWTAILFGLTFVVSPAYWIGNQTIVQRSLAAKSEYEAKASYVWGALLKNLIPLVIVVPGLMALVRFPHLTGDERDHALSKLIGLSFGPGVRGIFVAAFLAALMSSVDSYLNSATTLFAHDFYKRFWRPDADERRLLRVGRMMTVALTVWSVVFALGLLQLKDKGIYTIFQTLMAFIQGPAFAVLLTGLLTRRAVSLGALIGFLSGVFTTVSLFLLNQEWFCRLVGTKRLFRMDDPFLYFSMWAFLVSVVVTLALSSGQKPEPAEKLKYVLRRTTE
jgi:SSS family solute:Na+ symporter